MPRGDGTGPPGGSGRGMGMGKEGRGRGGGATPAGELEGRAEQGRAQDREGNAFA